MPLGVAPAVLAVATPMTMLGPGIRFHDFGRGSFAVPGQAIFRPTTTDIRGSVPVVLGAPALGRGRDLPVAQGGTGMLAETPGSCGDGHLLPRGPHPAKRANAGRPDPQVGGMHRTQPGSMADTPSPGKRARGLTAILERPPGAGAGGCTTPLAGVSGQAGPVTARGLSVMRNPGQDPAPVTGQIAAGCAPVAVTTGRGSACGQKPCPCIGTATGSEIFDRMAGAMDIDAGRILTCKARVAQEGRGIHALWLGMASGNRHGSEAQGLAASAFVTRIGVVT